MKLLLSLAFMPLLLLSACADHPPQEPASGTFVRGTARILSVDQVTGHVVMDYDNQPTQAYWQTETSFAQGGSLVNNGPLRPPVGQYSEPDVKTQAFKPKPGDTIQFSGMVTGHSIFLQSVGIIANQ
jgi:hypothetical protein